VGSGSVSDRAANQESETRLSIGETPVMDYFRFARELPAINRKLQMGFRLYTMGFG
jgi:hypothetical protein